MKYIKYLDSPIGKIGIIEENSKIINIEIGKNIDIKNNIKEKDTEILINTSKQLNEYFEGKRTKFDVPLNPNGTEFMNKVWNSLKKIPYGETKTYKQIAEEIDNPKAVRAVGMANHKNPIPIIIPCHRVIGSNGKLIGYALGLNMKEFLLELESKVLIKNIR